MVITGEVGYYSLHCNYKAKAAHCSSCCVECVGKGRAYGTMLLIVVMHPCHAQGKPCSKMQYDVVPVCQVTSENEWPYSSVTFLLFSDVNAPKHSNVYAVTYCYDSHLSVYLMLILLLVFIEHIRETISGVKPL